MVGQIKAATEKEARKNSRAAFSEFPGTSRASKVIQGQPVISCSGPSNRQSRQLELEVCLKHPILQDALLPGFLSLQAEAAEESLSRAFKWLFLYPRCSFYGS